MQGKGNEGSPYHFGKNIRYGIFLYVGSFHMCNVSIIAQVYLPSVGYSRTTREQLAGRKLFPSCPGKEVGITRTFVYKCHLDYLSYNPTGSISTSRVLPRVFVLLFLRNIRDL